jgi:hypothetical protein
LNPDAVAGTSPDRSCASIHRSLQSMGREISITTTGDYWITADAAQHCLHHRCSLDPAAEETAGRMFAGRASTKATCDGCGYTYGVYEAFGLDPLLT